MKLSLLIQNTNRFPIREICGCASIPNVHKTQNAKWFTFIWTIKGWTICLQSPNKSNQILGWRACVYWMFDVECELIHIKAMFVWIDNKNRNGEWDVYESGSEFGCIK